MSLYLPGTRQLQPCHRYCIITVISPNWPPRISWDFIANSASGFSGFAVNCSSRTWRYINAPFVGARAAALAGAGAGALAVAPLLARRSALAALLAAVPAAVIGPVARSRVRPAGARG